MMKRRLWAHDKGDWDIRENFACSLSTRVVQDNYSPRRLGRISARLIGFGASFSLFLFFFKTPPPSSRHWGVTTTVLETTAIRGNAVEARNQLLKTLHFNLGVLDTSYIR